MKLGINSIIPVDAANAVICSAMLQSTNSAISSNMIIPAYREYGKKSIYITSKKFTISNTPCKPNGIPFRNNACFKPIAICTPVR